MRKIANGAAHIRWNADQIKRVLKTYRLERFLTALKCEPLPARADHEPWGLS